jgi:hypothetical protein
MNIKKNGLVGVVALLMILTIVGPASAEIPPTPADLAGRSSGYDTVNFTWVAGSGNVTDGYNTSVSIGGATATWVNSTATFRAIDVGVGGSAEMWVYAYNNTDAGNLSTTYATTQTDTRFTDLIGLLNAIPDVLTPILAVIVIIIIIMAFMVVGYMITGTIDGITEAIKNAIRFKK